MGYADKDLLWILDQVNEIHPYQFSIVDTSVAMSGIPGGGGTGELVLCSLFFPDHLAVAFPIALALGNLVDPPATMVNAAGDYVVSFIVERYVNGKDWLQKKLAGKAESEA